MPATLLFVDFEVCPQRRSFRRRESDHGRELRRCQVIFLLQVELADSGGVTRIICGHELYWRALLLGEVDFDVDPIAFRGRT